MSDIPNRRSALIEATTDEKLYPSRMSTSTRRYQPMGNTHVFEQGNKRLFVHSMSPIPRRARHPFFYAGIGMTAAVVIMFVGGMIVSWWTNYQTDQKYGYPRTYQIDAVVGHNDSQTNPSHFIFLNLHGHIEIIEIPGGDASHTHIYTGPTLLGDHADQAPVTASFDDKTGRGTIDMVVHVEDQRIIYLNDGTQFRQQ